MPTVLEELKKQLESAIVEYGEDSLVVTSLRDQIDTYEKPQQSARDLYLMGGRGRNPRANVIHLGEAKPDDPIYTSGIVIGGRSLKVNKDDLRAEEEKNQGKDKEE
jgi:hypothetical protein